MQAANASGNVSAAETARFAAMAARWWDPDGPMQPLHRVNGARIAWIAARLEARFPSGRPRLLDIGCGGGIAAEALARRGYPVLGVDATPAAIAVARRHAADQAAAGKELDLDYRVGTAEQLAAAGEVFDAITALEVIEHIPDPDGFLAALRALLRPGGVLILSTPNRTLASLLTVKIGAEYLLRALPVGTHDWRRFLTPDELAAKLRAAGFRVADIAGLSPTLAPQRVRLGRCLAIDYFIVAET